MDQEEEEVTWTGVVCEGLMKEILKEWQDLDKTEASETMCPEGHDVSIEVKKEKYRNVFSGSQWRDLSGG